MDPLVSVLCVTEDRPEFMPWLAWNWARQSYQRKELLLVDSSEPEIDRSRPSPDRAFSRLAEFFFRCAGVTILRAPHGTAVGAKYARALEVAEGDYVCLWGDDDWQHPDRTRRSVELGAGGWNVGWFLHVDGERVMQYRASLGSAWRTIASSALVPTALAREAGFDDGHRGSDTRWIRRVVRCMGEGYPWTVAEAWPYSLWLVHGRNMTGRGYRWRPFERAALVDDAAWGDTDRELSGLRARLAPSP